MDHSNRGIDYQHIPRPIGVLSDEYPPGFHDPPHRHDRAQLLYAPVGEMLVITARASFVVPPQRAVWIPADLDHEIYVRGQTSLRSLYVTADVLRTELTRPRVIEVSRLLKELILEAASLPVEYDLNGREGRIMGLILDEITSTRDAPLEAPMPSDRRLVRVCTAILRDPSQTDMLEDWAKEAGMGRRTFTRLFREETGVSFAAWRQQVRLMEAVSRLSRGQPVTTVAFDVGYNSPSAFTAMFRRTFGMAPSQYLA
jgi:AraC-like DNA-binding protein